MKNLKFLSLFFFYLIFILSCVKKEDGVAPATSLVSKGNRKFGFHVTSAQGENFNTTFEIIVNNRFDHVNMHQIWGDGGISSLPTTPLATNSAGTTFDMSVIDIANAYYPAYSKAVMLTIGTIDTNNKFVPSNFNAVDFDQASIRSAFKSMLDVLIPKIASTEIISLQIGNEVDVYLGTNSVAWSKYKTFFDDVSSYAKLLRPNLKVGVTTTLSGAISDSQKSLIQQLNTQADIVAVTYYPMNADFTMKNLSVIQTEIELLVSLYPTKPIYFQEIGYSSGSLYIQSSEEMQKNAVFEVFKVWDLYSTQIPVISWLNLTEWPTSTVDGYGTQYGLCPGVYCNAFKEYLATLGVRSYSTGQNKPALTEILQQTSTRGW